MTSSECLDKVQKAGLVHVQLKAECYLLYPDQMSDLLDLLFYLKNTAYSRLAEEFKESSGLCAESLFAF